MNAILARRKRLANRIADAAIADPATAAFLAAMPSPGDAPEPPEPLGDAAATPTFVNDGAPPKRRGKLPAYRQMSILELFDS